MKAAWILLTLAAAGCIQTAAQCQQPAPASHAEQHGEEQRAEGAETKAGTK
jgi:hypothetical protein